MQTSRRNAIVACMLRFAHCLARGAPQLHTNNERLFHRFTGGFRASYQNPFTRLVQGYRNHAFIRGGEITIIGVQKRI